MDGRGKYIIHVPFSPSTRLPQSLVVSFDPVSYARTPHPDPAMEASIEARWEACVAANPALFNASKFRYAGSTIQGQRQQVSQQLNQRDHLHHHHPQQEKQELPQIAKQHQLDLRRHGNSPNPDSIWRKRSSTSSIANAVSSPADSRTLVAPYVIVHLGLTDYATFQGTHSVPNPLTAFGIDGLARPFGNAIVVETSDGFVPFLVRSRHTGEGAGSIALPGGHPEPSEIGITDDDCHLHACDHNSAPTDQIDDQDVAEELWNAARREVIEELFIPEERLSKAVDLRFLGIVAREIDEKALLAVWAALGMTADAVRASYVTGNVNNDESVNIMFVSTNDLPHIVASGRVSGFRVMPDHLGAIELAVSYYAWRGAEPNCAEAGLPQRLHSTTSFHLDMD